MTQEQKVMRTRDEQVIALAKAIGPERIFHLLNQSYQEEICQRAWSHIEEAEARGAEEARRVNAELSRAQMFCRDQKDASDRMPEREDVVQWQKDQNEFFLSTVLEVVTEYAVWRDRKDAEGQEPVAWVDGEDLPSEECQRRPAHLILKRTAIYSTPLYSRPANVAALEARVKVLEADQRKDQEVIHWLAEKLKQTDPEAKADYELLACAALTREGGE